MDTRGKSMSVLVLAILCVMVGTAWVTGSVAFGAERTLRLGHIMAPDDPIHKSSLRMAEVVHEKTGGRVEIRALPSEQLGTERQIMEGIQFGAVEMGVISGNIVQGFSQIAGLLSLPYMIRDFDHAAHVEDGPVGAEMMARILKEIKVRSLGFGMTGFRVLMARDKPVRSMEDFKGLKIRVPEAPMLVSTFKLLGANPTPIPWGELYTSLQTKVVDACEAPPAISYYAKLFEVAKHCTLTNHIYTYQFVMINEKLWQSLSEQDKAALNSGMKEFNKVNRKLIVSGREEILQRVQRELGVTVYTIDKEPLRKAVQPLYQDFGKSIEGGMALIDQVLKTP